MNTTLTAQQTLNLRQHLSDFLELLRDGQFHAIEYGDPTCQPGSYLSYLRIKMTRTPAGTQFRLCELYGGGAEGSGDYSFDADYITEAAMRLVMRYHRPPTNPALKVMWEKKQRPQLAWFGYNDPSEEKPSIYAMARAQGLKDFLPDAETVTLEKP